MLKVLIVVPAYNEEAILEPNILAIVDFCQKNLNFNWQITIADNNSQDQTAAIGKSLAQKYPNQIHYFFVKQKGKGLAIKSAWEKISADIYCFMDADLATNLSGLPDLINQIVLGHDLALGNRFDPASQIKRSVGRWIFSFIYRWLLQYYLKVKINDAPCGFKAINQKVKLELLPQVKNQGWFFDSELVILAEKKGYRLKEIPVHWQDPREGQNRSRVKVISLSLNYLKEIIKLKRQV